MTSSCPRHAKYTTFDERHPILTWILFFVMSAAILVSMIAAAYFLSINPPPRYNQNERFGFETDDEYSFHTFFDRKTGVYYMLVCKGKEIAVTPLLNLDGLPVAVDDMNHGDLRMGLKDVHSNLLEEDR